MFKKQLTLLAMSLTQPWHLFFWVVYYFITATVNTCTVHCTVPLFVKSTCSNLFIILLRKLIYSLLTTSLRRPFKPAILFWTVDRRTSEHAFRFLRVLPEAMSTRHSWLWQTLDDVYTRQCFSESEGTRFGAPGQKALPSVNEFTLLWIFA